MGYIRLQECSDWGYLYLSLPGQGLSSHGTSDHRRGLTFRDGQRVRIRWPDNSQTVETIVHRSSESSVGDMGHTYSVRNNRPGIEYECRGIRHWTPLASLDVLEEDIAK